MINLKRKDEIVDAEILECIALDASSILKSGNKSQRFQFASGTRGKESRRGAENVQEVVLYGKNTITS